MSTRRFAEVLADAAVGARDRYLDMAISWRVCAVERDERGRPHWVEGDDEEILQAGGRWDRLRRRWDGDAQTVVVMRIVRGGGQEAAARWFAQWFRCHLTGNWQDFKRAWSALLLGGRRSGKSHLACGVLVTYAILYPGSQVWAVSPAQQETTELETVMRRLLPASWYKYRGGGSGKSVTMTLVHGSVLLLLSGYKPSSLRRGDVDLVLYNEGQNMSKAGYVQLRAPMADHGGLVIIAANPPDRPIGRWIEEHLEGIQAGKIAGVHFDFDPSKNPWIDFSSLASMNAEVDEVTFDRDVLGLIRPVGDLVFHAWNERESRAPVEAGLEDVTAEVTQQLLRVARPWIVGMDFQRTPHMAAAVIKLFRRPGDPDLLTWIVGEAVVPDTNEDGLLDALEAANRWTPTGYIEGAGYRGDECAVVMDASAWWQDGDHTPGKASDHRLRARGWTALFRPQAESKRNPDIVERVKIGNARLRTADKKRHLFVTPECIDIAQAIRRWENRGGVPHRRSEYAHACDAWTYAVFRLFGKPKKPRGQGKASFAREATRADDLRAAF